SRLRSAIQGLEPGGRDAPSLAAQPRAAVVAERLSFHLHEPLGLWINVAFDLNVSAVDFAANDIADKDRSSPHPPTIRFQIARQFKAGDRTCAQGVKRAHQTNRKHCAKGG